MNLNKKKMTVCLFSVLSYMNNNDDDNNNMFLLI